jgi:hypothetical protein
MKTETMSHARRAGEPRRGANGTDGGVRFGRRAARALAGDTPAFLGFIGSLAVLTLMGLATALVLDLEGELRGVLIVACGVPFAALTWLIVWVIKNPLD